MVFRKKDRLREIFDSSRKPGGSKKKKKKAESRRTVREDLLCRKGKEKML